MASDDVRAEAIVAMTRVLMGLGWTLGDPDNEEDLQNPDVAEAYDVVAPLVRAQTGRDIAAEHAAEREAIQNDLVQIMEALGISTHARPYSSHDVVQREVLPVIRAIPAPERVAAKRRVAGAGGDTP